MIDRFEAVEKVWNDAIEMVKKVLFTSADQ